MKIILIAGPTASNEDSPETFSAIEPVQRVDLKTHARIENAAEDLYLDALIQAARAQVEEIECWIQLLTSTWELQIDRFPCGGEPIRLPRPPLQEVISVKYVDTDGVLQTLSDSSVSPVITSDVFVVDAKSPHSPERAEIYLAYDQSWPSTRAEYNAVRIRFRAGFGDTGDAVPAAIRQWIMIMAATMYEHREKEITGAVISHMQFVDGLLDPYRCRKIVI